MQESSKYREMVRQHVDLETIETRVEQGIYSSCHFNFYRDLLLLLNNAIVFFPKSSLESSTARELARLVSIEINEDAPEGPPPNPLLQRSQSLLDKQKSTAPIIVCRKRSSVSAKPTSTFAQKPDPCDHNNAADFNPSTERSRSSLFKLKTLEKSSIITGTRSSRRNAIANNNNNDNNPTDPPSSNNKKQTTGTGSGSVEKQGNKKKAEAITAADKKKSVVDFLKRIKKNSPPVQSGKKQDPKRNISDSKNNVSSCGRKGGKERRSSAGKKESSTTSPKKNVGRPAKKAADTTLVIGKRAREVVVAKRQSKRARR